MEILVTKELTLRWGVCPGLSGWNPVITRGPQTDEARGEVGDPEQEKDPPDRAGPRPEEHSGLEPEDNPSLAAVRVWRSVLQPLGVRSCQAPE